MKPAQQTRIAYDLQPETCAALAKVPANTVSGQSVRLGLSEGEPILVMADALLSYAKAYRIRFGDPISEDRVAADSFKAAICAAKVLIDYDGGVALRRGITTDSKDNGALFDIIEATCAAAGIDYQEL